MDKICEEIYEKQKVLKFPLSQSRKWKRRCAAEQTRNTRIFQLQM